MINPFRSLSFKTQPNIQFPHYDLKYQTIDEIIELNLLALPQMHWPPIDSIHRLPEIRETETKVYEKN